MKHHLKSKFNLIIDGIMLVVLTGLAGLGFLIKFILIPGEERWEIYGANVDMRFLGLDRHEWGSIHLTLGYIMIGLLFLHILLHWRIILGIFRTMTIKKSVRFGVLFTFILLGIFLILSPFMVKPEIGQEISHRRNRQPDREMPGQSQQKEAAKEVSRSKEPEIKTAGHEYGYAEHEPLHRNAQQRSTSENIIRGYMTIDHVIKDHDITLDEFRKSLNLPADIPSGSQLGHLVRLYDFAMQDIRRTVEEYDRKAGIN